MVPKFNLKSFTFSNLKFLNDLGWRTDINQSCRSRRAIQLYSWQHFHLKIIYLRKIMFEFLTFWPYLKLSSWTFFRLNSFRSQIFISKFNKMNTKGMYPPYYNKWLWDGMGKRGMGCAWGYGFEYRRPHVCAYFLWKITWLMTCDHVLLVGLLRIKIIIIFWSDLWFLKNNFFLVALTNWFLGAVRNVDL